MGRCIDEGKAYRIRADGRIVGGLVLQIGEKTHHNHLDLLFVSPDVHSRGVDTASWHEAERLYPETEVWEICTPYFEKRNLYFYINKCGFHAVEFFGPTHPKPAEPVEDGEGPDEFFRFEKRMK